MANIRMLLMKKKKKERMTSDISWSVTTEEKPRPMDWNEEKTMSSRIIL